MLENNKVTETVEVEGEIPRDYQIEWLPESIRIAISKHVLGYYSTANVRKHKVKITAQITVEEVE